MWSHRREGPGHCLISKKLLSVQVPALTSVQNHAYEKRKFEHISAVWTLLDVSLRLPSVHQVVDGCLGGKDMGNVEGEMTFKPCCTVQWLRIVSL